MASSRLIAVIDIGKTNAKLAVFDLATQREIDRHTTPNTVVNAAPYPHFDVDALWAFILASLKDLAAHHAINAISITTHGASAALLREDGTLALPVLDYEHDGPDALAASYDALRPPFSETGAPRLPGGLNLGAQLYWQQQQFPDAFAEARWIVMYPQYWAQRLCGVVAGEVTSLGCHTDLWAYRAADYSSLVTSQGWRRLMPPLRKAGDCLGPLKPALAAETDLPPGTPVYCGIHDSNASLVPHLLGQPAPFAVVSTGTWVVSMAVGGSLPPLDAARDTLINVNAFGNPVPSARFMGGREFQLLNDANAPKPTAADEGEVLARAITLLPSAVQGSGPFPHSKLRWFNAESASAAQRQVALSFYLALMTNTCLKLIGAQGPIIIEGPFSGNAHYMAMLQAATGRPVLISQGNETGTTRGAALLVGGAGPSHYDAVPAPANSAALADYAQAWDKQVVEA
ncbi:MAG: FGGY-family carbohydrate kinase [Alphaproteobacteria bacterium]|nr:FGGY-family carbohydrate kinase [Alphaproteobacteria bacterium]